MTTTNTALQFEETIVDLPLAAIVEWSDTNPRQLLDEEKTQELAQSIADSGLLHPIIVQRIAWDTPTYRGLIGSRRFAAFHLLNRETIPSRVLDSDADAATIAIAQSVENLQRVDLTPLEEARVIADLFARAEDMTFQEVARRTGRSTIYIWRRYNLVKLIPAAAELLAAERIPLGVAEEMARLTGTQQVEAVAYITRTLDDPFATSLTEGLFRRYVERSFHSDLSRVAFPLDDATIHPDAGACTTCPKLGANELALFPDLMSEADQKRCGDPSCMREKCMRYAEQLVVQLQRAGKPALRVSAESTTAESGVLADGALARPSWVEVEDEDECAHAQDAVLVGQSWASWNVGPGSRLRVCTEPSCAEHHVRPEGSKSEADRTTEEKAANKALKAERTFRAYLVHRTMQRATGADLGLGQLLDVSNAPSELRENVDRWLRVLALAMVRDASPVILTTLGKALELPELATFETRSVLLANLGPRYPWTTPRAAFAKAICEGTTRAVEGIMAALVFGHDVQAQPGALDLPTTSWAGALADLFHVDWKRMREDLGDEQNAKKAARSGAVGKSKAGLAPTDPPPVATAPTPEPKKVKGGKTKKTPDARPAKAKPLTSGKSDPKAKPLPEKKGAKGAKSVKASKGKP